MYNARKIVIKGEFMKRLIYITTMFVVLLTLSIGLVGCDKQVSYNIILNAGEGASVESGYVKVVEGKNYTLKVPSKKGYDFEAWYDRDNNKIELKGKWTYGDVKEVYAKYTPKKYVISFDLNGGTMDYEELNVWYNQNYTLSNPTKKGYTFSKWKNGETDFSSQGIWQLDSNLTLNAEYTANSYKVNYEADESLATLSKTTEFVVYDSKIDFPEIIFKGDKSKEYSFVGFNVKGTETILAEEPEKWNYDTEINLVAVFAKNTYTINFKEVDGVSLDAISGYYYQEITLPTPTKKGYNFVGYSYEGATSIYTNTKWIIEDNVVLEPVFEPVEFDITLNAGKGKINGVSQTTIKVKYDESLTKYLPERLGYNFVGWLYDGEMFKDTSEIYNRYGDAQITLIAIWRDSSWPEIEV